MTAAPSRDREAPAATSVCTVPAGMANFEHWPEPVIQIVIAGLTTSEDKTPVCPPHIGTGTDSQD